jgi:hypothetical protein
MTDRNKDSDELPEKRSERSIPLNVETMLFEGARKPQQFTPAEEDEKLKKDGSDLDTIRGDLETPEPVPREIAKGTGKSKNYGKTSKN